MSINLQLKIDRNKGSTPKGSKATYYPVTDIFWQTCKAAGDDLVIEACIESLYDEDCINYPASRVELEKCDGNSMVGLIPR
jgi:hypothetical protein